MATTNKPPAAVDANSEQIRRLTRINRILSLAMVVIVLGIAAALVWLWATTDSGEQLEDDIFMTQEVVDGLNAAVEAADAQAVGVFFADNAFFEDPAVGMSATGRSAIEGMYMSFLNATTPIRNTEVFVGPGFSVTEFEWVIPCTFASCTPDAFMEPVELRGVILHVIEDGLVVRETDYIAYPRNAVLP